MRGAVSTSARIQVVQARGVPVEDTRALLASPESSTRVGNHPEVSIKGAAELRAWCETSWQIWPGLARF
jgi:hypothetical protein